MSEALECPICSEILRDAYVTFCGHAFCESCLLRWLQQKNFCPICRKNPSPIHPDFALRRIAISYRKLSGEPDATAHTETAHSNPDEERLAGNLAYQRGDYAEAISAYTRAMSKQRDPILYANRAQCYVKLGQFRAGLEDCDEATKLNPGFGPRLQWMERMVDGTAVLVVMLSTPILNLTPPLSSASSGSSHAQ
ncbi:hypothetical protein PAPYR_8360 [Paratrimastix pyriformis]|uniref:RING-type domain-containing protein n=1 Tax=Paratrimastix pyriformis TaxID=342808 RepID=A0ABQ8UG71_9EUKA|nr:hypothetical protein PAPYR_8360 [Paratrimastix pyriformis]